MATYASTVTLDHPQGIQINHDLEMIIGKCDVTTYSKTGLEITDITKYFKDKTHLRVICDGLSDNGYLMRWNTTDSCFHAYYPKPSYTPAGSVAAPTISVAGTASAHTLNLSSAANDASLTESGNASYTGITGVQAPAFSGTSSSASAGAEVGESVDVGEVNFIAVGIK